MEILRLDRDKVEALIQEGLDSGEPTPMTKDDWARLRRELEERLTQVKSA
jgi:hypothetical protein